MLKEFDAEDMEIQLSFREVGAILVFFSSVESRREFAMTAESMLTTLQTVNHSG